LLHLFLKRIQLLKGVEESVRERAVLKKQTFGKKNLQLDLFRLPFWNVLILLKMTRALLAICNAERKPFRPICKFLQRSFKKEISF